jgi:release factor glutamine methyltransferase
VTVAEALRRAAAELSALTDTARLDAELLMAEVLGVSRSEMLLRHMHAAEPATFADLIARRARHEPVAYILGRQEFYGREFSVAPGVLIPRSDSETTVAAALEACPAPRRVLDCGVGSGALLQTLLAEVPRADGVGIDRSADALAIASTNARRHDLSERAALKLADWRQADWSAGLGRFDLVVANPPYVEDGAELAPSVRAWEPGEALFAGPNGLDDYRILIPQLPRLLEPAGVTVLEIGYSQAEPVGALAVAAGFTVDLRRDLAGRPRALILRTAPE